MGGRLRRDLPLNMRTDRTSITNASWFMIASHCAAIPHFLTYVIMDIGFVGGPRAVVKTPIFGSCNEDKVASGLLVFEKAQSCIVT
jgi:hypothetical protein